MAIKKSEIYSSLWKSCDELRGGMDASQYKDYVLVLLFVKYVSDKYAGQKDPMIEVPEKGGFKDMIALKGNTEIGDEMNKIIGRLAETNNLKGVIDLADFNDSNKLGKGKEMVDRLSNLIAIFESPGLDFSRNRTEGDDLLGDAYEYLMRHFATESGKSKGQFYTPAEVSRVMAKVVGIRQAIRQDQTLYDPTCGSGSLLLKAANEAPHGITIYGQEKDNSTTGLARMNMILHGKPEAEICNDNTLSAPYFKNQDFGLKTFDFVVVNPPFSDKAWSNGLDPSNDEFKRFEDGIPPSKNGDYAYLLHVIKSIKSTGKGAIILPHGVLFRGNAEAGIRKNLVRKGVIKGIISLPPNLFYGTGIPACIIVLDKENASTRKSIFMIDASKGFMKDGNKNRLRHQDIYKIADVFNKQIEIDRYSRMVNIDEIEKNDYNLNIPRYIDSTDPEDLQDIDAHLKGGIPECDVNGLNSYWQICPTLKDSLFGPADRPGYSQLKVEASQIRPTIFEHSEFVAFTEKSRSLFDQWKINNVQRLKDIKKGDHPTVLIDEISEDLLRIFAEAPLIDKYDIYQHLMSYWTDTMHDDVYMIISDGWQKASNLRLITDKKSKEKADIVVGKTKLKAELIPTQLVAARYFAAEKATIEKLESDVDAISRQMEEMEEEHGGEDGLLAEAKTDKGKLTKASITARRKEIKRDKDADDERKVLKNYLDLIGREAATKKKVKEDENALYSKVAAKYRQLTEEEVKTLVVDDKWLATLDSDLQTEVDRVSQALTGRIKQLAERYANPLPKLTDEVETLSSKVDEHLERMGFAWK